VPTQLVQSKTVILYIFQQNPKAACTWFGTMFSTQSNPFRINACDSTGCCTLWILEETAATVSTTLPTKPPLALIYQSHTVGESDGRPPGFALGGLISANVDSK
jgi:hypothetical protein